MGDGSERGFFVLLFMILKITQNKIFYKKGFCSESDSFKSVYTMNLLMILVSRRATLLSVLVFVRRVARKVAIVLHGESRAAVLYQQMAPGTRKIIKK